MKSGNDSLQDPLLAFREEFPILEKTTYLVSNSLGPMPRSVPGKLAEYARDWGELRRLLEPRLERLRESAT